MATSAGATPIAAFLRSVPYFARLNVDELSTLAANFAVRRYTKGELIILEGEPCRGLFLVQSGRVRIYKTSLEGREQVLNLAGPGDSFNEVPNFDGGPNPASAEALAASCVLQLRPDLVMRMVERYPSVAAAMLHGLARRLRHLSTVVEDLSFKHVTSRLAKVLLEYAAEPAAGHEAGLKQRLTQTEMAAMIGTAREMVGRSLKSLEAQGALRVEHHRIIIKNKSLLQKLL